MKTNRVSWKARVSILLGLALSLASGILAHMRVEPLTVLDVCQDKSSVVDGSQGAGSQILPEQQTVEAFQKFAGEPSVQTLTAQASPIQIGGATKKNSPTVEQEMTTNPRGVVLAKRSQIKGEVQKTLTEVLLSMPTDQRKSGQGSTTHSTGAVRRETLSLRPAREHNLGLYVIYDAWWEQGIDSNGDGYTEYRMLYTDVDATDGGSHTIYLKIYYKLASSSTWSLYFTTPNYLITGDSGYDAIWVAVGLPNQELSMNVYDFKVEVYETGNPTVAVTGDPSTDSDLNDQLFETAAEDQRVGMPVISPNSGSIPITATITCSTVGAEIRYTLDGIDPTATSTLYASPIQITSGSNVVLKARGFKSGVNPSAVAIATYTSTSTAKTVTVSSGWNIVSVPVQASDMSVSALFPDAVPPAYGFSNGYVSATALSVGIGYWLKFPGAKTYSITGTAVRPANIGVSAGWNIIGAFDFDYATASITPLSLVVSPYYGYSNGYVAATTLTSGKGYWVKTSSAGTLSLQAPSGTLVDGLEAAVGEPTAGSIAVEIKDNNGNSCVLYLAEGGKGSELPPLPPQGIFDVRFASNGIVDNIGVGRHEILLSSVVYPVKVVARGTKGRELWINDDRGSAMVSERLEEGKEVTIVENLGRIVLSEKSLTNDVPQQYELSQNYPNPFNPTTVIKFALPEAGRVHLSLFNVLGEKVAELVDGERGSGNHQVEFNAGGIPSGMYFYRLEAGSFVAVKKLVVVK
jgi:hypothetical protein